MQREPVRIRAVIPMPDPPPGLPRSPDPYATDWWDGTLLAWRWTDKPRGEWTALVRYTRPNGLTYEHWVPNTVLEQVTARPDGV